MANNIIYTKLIRDAHDRTGISMRELEAKWKEAEQQVNIDRMMNIFKYSHLANTQAADEGDELYQEITRKFNDNISGTDNEEPSESETTQENDEFGDEIYDELASPEDDGMESFNELANDLDGKFGNESPEPDATNTSEDDSETAGLDDLDIDTLFSDTANETESEAETEIPADDSDEFIDSEDDETNESTNKD